MPDTLLIIIAALLFTALTTVVAIVITRNRAETQIRQLRDDNSRLQAEVALEQRKLEEKSEAFAEAQTILRDSFSALSTDALKNNNDAFLKLAQENLKQFQLQAKGELEKREQSIKGLVAPIQQALAKTDEQIRLMEQERKQAYGSIKQHLESMTQTQQQLQDETRNLVQALRRPEVRGQWGELTLKRLVELAGMVEHCDFYEQEEITTDSGRMRPDMIIRMPDAREIVVDVKTPLDAYLSAIEAGDDETRERELDRHTRHVRERVRELASKAYWKQFKNAPDFVVLFIPGEQFLSAALDRDRTLLEDALRERVILTTPTSFIALLRAVGYGWRQMVVAENAEIIRDLGEELYKRLATFGEHLAKLGKSLGSSVDHYNKAVGSLERQVLPSARRFEEMGISAKKTLPELDPLDKIVRDSSETD